MTEPDVCLGAVVREIPALLHLLDYLEANAPSIYVRERINGEIGNHALADLPAPLALHWAFEVIRKSTIPIRTTVKDHFSDFLDEDEDEEPEP